MSWQIDFYLGLRPIKIYLKPNRQDYCARLQNAAKHKSLKMNTNNCKIC